MGSRSKQVDKTIGAKLAPDHPFHDIVQEAYAAFSSSKPSDLGVCRNCCMSPEVEADFLNPDRAHLPLSYVQDWFFAAAEIPMPRAPWVYLLPRVLEILAAGEEAANVGIEVTLSRFPTGDPAMWNDRQNAVLARFASAFLDAQKTSTTDYLDDILCMFGLAKFDLSALLAQVEGWSDAELATKLHHDWAHPCGGGTIWITAFWEAPRNTQAFTWYTSRRLYDRMAAFGLDEATPKELADKALIVADIIRENADWA